jgi:membrane protease YdiL (CAAX protease family)
VTEELIPGFAGQAVGGVLVIAGSIPLVMFLRKRIDHRSMEGIGLARPGAVGGLLTGFGIGALAMGIVLAVSVATHAVHLAKWNPHGLGVALAIGIVGSNLIFFLGVGFTEELLFRGYILQNLGEQMPLWGALLLQSALFGVFHGLQATPVQLIEIALGGLMLGLLRIAAGTLWLAIGFHSAWDFVEDGIVKTRLLPSHGPELEQTAAGWIVPIVIVLIVVAVLARRRPPFNWSDRLDHDGVLAPAVVPVPAT